MSSLREQCKERLKIAFDHVRAVSGSLTFILIVDQIALKIVSNTIKMMQLINYGITSVQRLELKRKKFQKIQAVYLIHPNSYQLILDDYSVKGEPQYHIVHILTLTKIPQLVMNSFAQCPELAKRIKNLKEINMNFLLHSHSQFIIDQKQSNSFELSIQSEGQQYQNFIANTVDQLSTVLTSLSAFFIVEILYSKPVSSNISEKIALGLKSKLETMFKIYEKYDSKNYTNSAPQTTIIILDRSFDAVSPLARSFHYLPLLYEYKEIKNHKLMGKDKKVYSLDQNDEIFRKFRYIHLAETGKGLKDDFDNFSQNHVAAKFEKNQHDNSNINNIAEVMKKIPQYTQSKDKYSIHIKMVNQLFENYGNQKSIKLGQLQQSILSLTNKYDKKVKPGDLFNQLIDALNIIKDKQQKIRLISIALMCLELKPKEKSILFEEIQKNSNYKNINKKITYITGSNLYCLNNRKDKNNKQQSLILDKHVPKIQEIIKDVVNGGQADLKFLRVGSDSKSQKSNLGKGASSLGRKKIGQQSDKDKVNKPRIILFVCSALGYNQIRSISQFEQNYQIIYGSHKFVTPKEYLKLINGLSSQ